MLSCVALKRGSLLVLMAALASMCTGIPLVAQDASGGKIGVFDGERILAESQAGQQALALLNQLNDQRVGELQVQQNAINTLQQQGVSAPPGSPDAARIQREMEDLMLRFERLQQDVEQELGLRQNELTAEITEMVAQTIDVIAEEDGYTLIFNAVQSGLVYVDPMLEITDEIIQRVDAMSAPDPL